MKRKICIVLIIALCLTASLGCTNYGFVKADELSDNISDQLDNIDLSELEDFFNNIENKPNDADFLSYVKNLLSGEYNVEFESVFDYLFSAFFSDVKKSLPTLISVLVIAIFCGIMQGLRSSFLSQGIDNIILFVSLLSIILLLTGEMISMWQTTKNIIENIAKLCDIMSPVILTLMLASGGNVSAAVYKPAVAFLSNGVVNIFLSIILPLVGIIIAFSVISNFSTSIKISKFIDFTTGIIKWLIGLIIAVFGIFLSIQGITSATYDGISIKAAKYAISNSVPIIGGFLKDGFDLVIAGSILIKNAIGVSSLIALFYSVISPVLYMASFSLILKFISALTEPIADVRISGFCTSISKCITYLIVALLSVGFMLFITILLLTFSANAIL